MSHVTNLLLEVTGCSEKIEKSGINTSQLQVEPRGWFTFLWCTFLNLGFFFPPEGPHSWLCECNHNQIRMTLVSKTHPFQAHRTALCETSALRWRNCIPIPAVSLTFDPAPLIKCNFFKTGNVLRGNYQDGVL